MPQQLIELNCCRVLEVKNWLLNWWFSRVHLKKVTERRDNFSMQLKFTSSYGWTCKRFRNKAAIGKLKNSTLLVNRGRKQEHEESSSTAKCMNNQYTILLFFPPLSVTDVENLKDGDCNQMNSHGFTTSIDFTVGRRQFNRVD